ncbi:MAG: DUF2911 domain-containing protein [Rhodothermaceae bacterium]|nr:DUF2911 domain-containing protein [Rhodothermaceae bacterium]
MDDSADAAMQEAPHGDMPQRGNDEARPSPNAYAGQTIGTTNVMISYGRPAVRGREIYGTLVPYGEVWRTGANEATVFHVSDDVQIEGQSLPAGTYGLFTIPTEDGWTIIFNNVAEQWGAFNYDASQDALRVDVMSEEAPVVEQMAFWFDDVDATSGTVVLSWAGVQVPFTIEVDG